MRRGSFIIHQIQTLHCLIACRPNVSLMLMWLWRDGSDVISTYCNYVIPEKHQIMIYHFTEIYRNSLRELHFYQATKQLYNMCRYQHIGYKILEGKFENVNYYLRRTAKVIFSSLLVCLLTCLFVCLFVCLWTTLRKKLVNGFSWNFQDSSGIIRGAIWKIWDVSHLIPWVLGFFYCIFKEICVC